MKMTIGCSAWGSNSPDVAPVNLSDDLSGPQERLPTWDAHHVLSPLDHSQLETEADTKEWNLLLASVLDGKHHALCSSVAETSRNENASDSISIDRCEPLGDDVP